MSITCTSQKLLALKAFLFEHPAILALIEMFINHQRTICIREGFPEFKDHGYILLTAYRCDSISEVTELCEVDRNTVRRWIDRFLKKAPSLLELNDESELKSKLLELLADLPRSGRPSKRTLERVILLNMLLAVKPDTLAREDCIVVSPEFKENFKDVCKWNTRLLGIALNISPATVSRYLKKFNISLDNQGTSKWQYCFSTDPNYMLKTLAVDLAYRNAEKNGYVLLCFDEKLGIHAVTRNCCQNAAGYTFRQERFVYHGKTNLLALLRPGTGEVFAEFNQNKDADTVINFLLSSLAQYADKKVLIIMDNLSVHGGVQKVLQEKCPNVSFLYIPSNSSWQNLVESFFGIIERKVFKGSSFDSVEQLEKAGMDFIAKYNEDPKPFAWHFDVERHLNQRANTLKVLEATVGDLRFLENLKSNVVNDAQTSVLSVVGKAAQDTVSPSEEFMKIEATGIKAPPVTTEQLCNGLPAFNRNAYGLNDKQENEEENRYVVLNLSQKVKEAQSNPSKAMALVSELLKYSEKPSRKETVRKVTQQQIDKQVAQVKTRQRQKEAAEQAGKRKISCESCKQSTLSKMS